jgi:hypothetical protein
MEKLIKSKNELILGTIGILLLVSLIAISSWVISFLAVQIGKAVTSEKSSEATMNFDLKGAERLNFKGLVQ